MYLEAFRREHLAHFDGFAANEGLIVPFMQADEVMASAEEGGAISGFGEGIFFGCGGFVEITPHRALCWALIHPTNPRYFYKIHKIALWVVEEAGQRYERLEAYIDPDFFAAARWVKMLGFHCECKMKPYYFPDGRSASEWVRLRD